MMETFSTNAILKIYCCAASKSSSEEYSPVKTTLELASTTTPIKRAEGADVGADVGKTDGFDVGEGKGRNVG